MNFLMGAYPIGEYYLVMTLLSFILFGADKYRARRGAWRIPERHLLLLCAAGGAFGGFLGMALFNHKVKRIKFLFFVPLSLLLHLILFAKFS